MSDIRQHPNFHQGFYDAMKGEPLFDDADSIYAKGWRSYWVAKEMLAELKKRDTNGSDDAYNIRSSFG